MLNCIWDQKVISPGLEPGTFRVLGERDNHYTTKSYDWEGPITNFYTLFIPYELSTGVIYFSLTSTFIKPQTLQKKITLSAHTKHDKK